MKTTKEKAKNLKIAVAMGTGIIRNTFMPENVVKSIEDMGTVEWNPGEMKYDTDQLKEAVQDTDICITGWGNMRFTEYVLKDAAKLRIIAHTGGSVATLVSEYLFEKGIKVISGNKLYAESVAEGVVGYILSSLRDIPFYSNDVQNGGWGGAQAYNEGLLDQTVGLIGFGAVARYLAGMLKVFRTTIKAYDPFVSEETCSGYGVIKTKSLEEVITGSKIISLHLPRIPETYHLIDKRILTLIPDNALLINTARGDTIDEEALADELQTRRFKAVLDVFTNEPLPAESRLRHLDNVILMPHAAGPTVDRRPMVTYALLEDIRRFYRGLPLEHEIKKEYAMRMTR